MRLTKHSLVWEIWKLALFGFILGHLFLNVGDILFGPVFSNLSLGNNIFSYFLKTLPIWFFVVLIVVTLAKNRHLSEELEHIEDINNLLKNTNQENKFQLISEAKLEDLLLNLDTLDKPIQINNISHITIEEHYSLIFTQN